MAPEQRPSQIMETDRISQLIALRKSRLLAAAAASLPKKMLRARLDCLIYFHTRFFPWKIRKRGIYGTLEQRVEEGGVYDEQRLGSPRRSAIQRAITRIHKTCPEESKAYELALRRFREVRRRFLATETKESWEWYLRGKGNSQNVYFRSWMNRRFAGNGFSDQEGKVGYFLYRYEELLSRKEERKRARRQIKEAMNEMEHWREVIFDKMGVPEVFRALV
jgi:hypothetical protein